MKKRILSIVLTVTFLCISVPFTHLKADNPISVELTVIRQSWELIILVPVVEGHTTVSLENLVFDFGNKVYHLSEHPDLRDHVRRFAAPSCIRIFDDPNDQYGTFTDCRNISIQYEASNPGDNFWWDRGGNTARFLTFTDLSNPDADPIALCSSGENTERCPVSYRLPVITPPPCPAELKDAQDDCLFVKLNNNRWIMKDLVSGQMWKSEVGDEAFIEALGMIENWDVTIQEGGQNIPTLAELLEQFTYLEDESEQIEANGLPAAGVDLWWYLADVYCTVVYEGFNAGLPLMTDLVDATQLDTEEFNEQPNVGEWTSTTNNGERYRIHYKKAPYSTNYQPGQPYFEIPWPGGLQEPVGFRCLVEVPPQ